MCLFADTLSLYIPYNEALSLSDIIQYSMQQMQHNTPQALWITQITPDSFTGAMDADKDIEYINPNHDLLNTAITHWDAADIRTKGLYLYVNHVYVHRGLPGKISCEYMDRDHEADCKHSSDPMQCPIYHAMMRPNNAHTYTEDDYDHLNECTHFAAPLEEKPQCMFYRNCCSFKRLNKAGGWCSIADRCHMRLFKHPIRSDRAMDNQQTIN
eukprot:407079_1